MNRFATSLCALLLALAPLTALADGVSFDARTANSGNWSDPATWENRHTPGAGDSVQVRPGHVVTYDVSSDAGLKILHVAGTLSFSREKSTRLDVSLLKIQPGEECSPDGFTCAVHHAAAAAEKKNQAVPAPQDATRPPETLPAALEIGTRENPMPAGVTANVRLAYFEGSDKDTLPALVTCGGRLDLHGSPMSRTWVKLAETAEAGAKTLTLAEPVTGWRPGDKVIVTMSHTPEYTGGVGRGKKSGKEYKYLEGAEEHVVESVEGATLKLKSPLAEEHAATEAGACEVANLSRNVIIESADPKGVRGHTMYHRNSSGSISYAEFRHLGKEGVLGKYPVHFHLVRDGLRNSGGVVGASIWDSKNRFMAIHGTDYLLVRDCVGYKSVGHGFFLEDATEQYNLLDRNLAVQALRGKRLPDQALPFDANEGAGFWWANGRNTLVRNVACENDRYGFRFEIAKIGRREPVLPLRQPDGSVAQKDVRHIPFLRFEDNESHSEGLYSFFFGDDPAGSVRGDKQHPFIARNLRAWETHYALRPTVAFFLMEKLDVNRAAYGVYHPDYDAHVYRDVKVVRVGAEPINRGHDDESIQFGSFTYDGLTIENCSGQPLIQLSCTAPVDGLAGHFRNLKVIAARYPKETRVVDLGVGPILPDRKLEKGVAYYFHDSPGASPGKAVRVVSEKFPDLMKDGHEYKQVKNFTGKRVRAAEVDGVEFPRLLEPVDDLPPATMITAVRKESGKLLVRGVTHDNGEVATVRVNGKAGRIVTRHAGVADWEATLEPATVEEITAGATDKAGNEEKVPAKVAMGG
jgi:hypothetical protein